MPCRTFVPLALAMLLLPGCTPTSPTAPDREVSATSAVGASLANPPAPPRPALAPDRNVSERPYSGGVLAYPVAMLQAGREGSVDVACDVTIEGRTRNCLIVWSAGGTEFEDAALDYVARARYAPAIQNGKPIQVRHKWTIAFKLNGNAAEPPAGIPQIVSAALSKPLPLKRDVSQHPIAGPALVYPPSLRAMGKDKVVQAACVVATDARAKNCSIVQSAGDPLVDAAALDYLSHSWFEPAVQNGVAVERRQVWTIPFRLRDAPPPPVVRAVSVPLTPAVEPSGPR